MMRRHHPAPRFRQRGAALLMALIIVTLISTLAVSMVWQQWRAVQVETAERARQQSAWILTGALDWTRIILKEDARRSGGGIDHLGEPWAVPLAEARLSTFLAADKDNTDDAPETFLSGHIVDANARYNLRNLVDATGKLVPAEVEVLQRLCSSLSISVTVAQAIAVGLKDSIGALHVPPPPDVNPNPPLMPTRLDQLAWFGVDPQTLRLLEPYVILLPEPTKVNLNTAPREVLAAVIPNVDLGSAERLVQVRQRSPFKDLTSAQANLAGITLSADKVAVTSNYFIVTGRLRLNTQVLEQRSLVRRQDGNVVPLSREWVNSNDPG
ncbi:MAG: type II secretion system minor pseudopilin GspK [Rhizobacter sp.]